MTAYVPSLLANDAESPHSPLLVVSSSAHSLSPLPVIAHYLARPQPVVLVSALYEPRKLGWRKGCEGTIVDLRSWIEGFDSGERDSWGVAELEAEVWRAVQTCSSICFLVVCCGWPDSLFHCSEQARRLRSSSLTRRRRLRPTSARPRSWHSSSAASSLDSLSSAVRTAFRSTGRPAIIVD